MNTACAQASTGPPALSSNRASQLPPRLGFGDRRPARILQRRAGGQQPAAMLPSFCTRQHAAAAVSAFARPTQTASRAGCYQQRRWVAARLQPQTSNGDGASGGGGTDGSGRKPPSGGSGDDGQQGGRDGGEEPEQQGTAFGQQEELYHRRRHLLAEMIRSTLLWVAGLSAAAGAVLAVLPSLVSHPLGLQATLVTVNLLTPAVIQIDGITASWSQPLEVRGLRLLERTSTATAGAGASSSGSGGGAAGAGGAPLSGLPAGGGGSAVAGAQAGSSEVSSSAPRAKTAIEAYDSSDEEELAAAAAAAGWAARPEASGPGSSSGRQQGGAHSSTQAATSALGSTTMSGRRVLLAAESIKASGSLWQLLMRAPTDVLVMRPEFDCSLNAAGTPRLVAVLEKAGLVPTPRPPRMPAEQQQRGGTATSLAGVALQSAPRSKAAASASASAAAAQQEQEHGELRLPVRRSAAMVQSSSDSEDEAGALPASVTGAAADASSSGRSRRTGRGSGGQELHPEHKQQPAGLVPATAGSEAASTGGGWAADAAFQRADSRVGLSGEVRLGTRLHVYLSQGTLHVPSPLRDLLGKTLHVELLRGDSAIAEAAAESVPASSSSKQQPVASAKGAGTAGEAGSSGSSSTAVKAPPRPLLSPWGAGLARASVALRVDAPHLSVVAEGWQTTKGFVRLRGPITARLDITPALSRLLLRKLNPLLGSAVASRGAASLHASLSPHDSLWPTAAATLRLAPVTLQLGSGPVLQDTLGVLRLLRPGVGGNLASSSSSSNKGGMVRAELSPLVASLSAEGSLVAERLDMHLALPGLRAPLHLVTWGRASLKPGGEVDMVLCLPSDTLCVLGLKGLPPGFGVPLRIGGTVDAPKAATGSATRQLALLLARQQAAKLAGRELPDYSEAGASSSPSGSAGTVDGGSASSQHPAANGSSGSGLGLVRWLGQQLGRGAESAGLDLSFRIPPPPPPADERESHQP